MRPCLCNNFPIYLLFNSLTCFLNSRVIPTQSQAIDHFSPFSVSKSPQSRIEELRFVFTDHIYGISITPRNPFSFLALFPKRGGRLTRNNRGIIDRISRDRCWGNPFLRGLSRVYSCLATVASNVSLSCHNIHSLPLFILVLYFSWCQEGVIWMIEFSYFTSKRRWLKTIELKKWWFWIQCRSIGKLLWSRALTHTVALTVVFCGNWSSIRKCTYIPGNFKWIETQNIFSWSTHAQTWGLQ